jgi:hypothetical protein
VENLGGKDLSRGGEENGEKGGEYVIVSMGDLTNIINPHICFEMEEEGYFRS